MITSETSIPSEIPLENSTPNTTIDIPISPLSSSLASPPLPPHGPLPPANINIKNLLKSFKASSAPITLSSPAAFMAPRFSHNHGARGRSSRGRNHHNSWFSRGRGPQGYSSPQWRSSPSILRAPPNLV
ncbi:hypothetical protein LIER_11270 [Lithospermum erythrorhizon]|uniref:Uncharacterized protein n=1 Tax=Lithospermum erythrorhizon TaxID=34254 RepID=A0AAV3PP02_LITER